MNKEVAKSGVARAHSRSHKSLSLSRGEFHKGPHHFGGGVCGGE